MRGAWAMHGRVGIVVFAALAAPLQAMAGTGAVAEESAAQMRVRRFALLVGSNAGGPGRVPLRWAGADAEAFGRVLDELGGVEGADRSLLIDPSELQLRGAIDAMRERVASAQAPGLRREVIVYYSGHSDERGLLLGSELYPYGELRRTLETLPAEVRIAILDSCASGAMTRRKGGVRRAPFLIDVSAQVQGHAILTSASAAEAAQESERVGGSFFTHYLVSGLRGAADISGDGRVTLTEAYQFAFHETLARTQDTLNGPQHPNYDIQLAGSGDLVMTDLRQTSATLVLAPDAWGRYFVRDGSGKLTVELSKRAGAATEIALAPGRYDITLERDEGQFRTESVLSRGQRAVVGERGWVEVNREVAMARGTAVKPTHDRGRAHDGVPRERVPEENHEAEDVEGARGVVATVVPGVTAPWGVDADTVRGFSVNLVYGRSARVRGVELGLINRTDVEMVGLQVGLLLNLDFGHVQGTLLGVAGNLVGEGGRGALGTLTFNLTGQSFTGVQVAPGFNLTLGDAHGLLVGGLFNASGGKGSGAWIAGGFNWVTGDAQGTFQGAAGVNITGGHVQGTQLSFAGNLAGKLDGAQIGTANLAGGVDGAQVGLVNVSWGDVRGSQVGLINIAAAYREGAPVGLINLVGNGQLHVDTWAGNLFLTNVSLRFGSERVYTVLHAGLSPSVDGEAGRGGVGIGAGGMMYLIERLHLGMDLSYYQADLKASGVDRVRLFQGDSDHLMQLRVILGYKFLEHLGLFAGAGLNAAISRDEEAPPVLGDVGMLSMQAGTMQAYFWPGFFGGVAF